MKQAPPSAVFKFAAARLIIEPVEGTRKARNGGDAEEHAAEPVDRWFPPARMAALRQ
jgi:hypothetical protein